jgi:adenylosuccinate synthase
LACSDSACAKEGVVGATALVGCQWGDEGKGKIVDVLSARVDAVARYQGGANAGHTVAIGDGTHVLHLLPTGILRAGVTCLLGNGMVIDPAALIAEIEAVRKLGIDVSGRLYVSPRAHVILPDHRAVERRREAQAASPIGTTLRGIGPAYETKAARIGLRVGDFLDASRLGARVEAIRGWARAAGCAESELVPISEVLSTLAAQAEAIVELIADVRRIALDVVARGGELLLEGAQGTLLDEDHGSYPFVTASSAAAGGVAPGLGIPPASISRVLGVTKAYSTRVGAGPFPTEFSEEVAEPFRRRAGEFGSTTGRPRRCGWLDGVLLKYAVEVNGLTGLIVTKLDVLDGFETLQVAVAYEGSEPRRASAAEDVMYDLERHFPVYERVSGWSESTSGTTRWSDLPAAARRYLNRIAEISGVPLAMVSTGQRRDEVIVVKEELLPGRSSRR